MSELKEGVVLTAEQVAEIEGLKSKIATLETEKSNVVGELQDDRKKRQELNDEIKTLQDALADATKSNVTKVPSDDVAGLIDQKLAERDASVAKSNKIAAIERFVNEHKEFHPENDTTGKRREALENALKRFNTEGLISEKDFYQVVSDASRLLGTDTVPTNQAPVENPYSSTYKSPNDPKVVSDGDLSEGEKRLMEKNGWSKDRFLTMKAKNPKYIENLVQLASRNY